MKKGFIDVIRLSVVNDLRDRKDEEAHDGNEICLNQRRTDGSCQYRTAGHSSRNM